MMAKVAKLLIIDTEDKHLLLHRSNHPTFGTDPDLPGGTIEEGETTLEAMLRETAEEVGLELDAGDIRLIYSGVEYSQDKTQYNLYICRHKIRPNIVLSWEHSSFEWLAPEEFLAKAKYATDNYMHMVYDKLK
jgi:8-oxo-dGTP diphosphatase